MRTKADSTLRSSRAVPHPSTNRALRRLTSEVRRDPVYSTRYGRQRMACLLGIICTVPHLIDCHFGNSAALTVYTYMMYHFQALPILVPTSSYSPFGMAYQIQVLVKTHLV